MNVSINLVIVLLICFILFRCTVYSINTRCPQSEIRVSYARGTRMPGTDYKERVGFDTVNIKLDRDFKCGIYEFTSTYGKGVLYISVENNRLAYANFEDMKSIKNTNIFDFWDIKRMTSDNNLFIKTYNNGCCSTKNRNI